MSDIALRIDDIGASTKVHERYCENRWLNIGPLRDRRIFGAWGPYREMNPEEWDSVFTLLRSRKAKLTVAITAAWVEADGSLVPFPEKFPEEFAALKRGQKEGLIEIAGHGLTHCVLEDKLFLPRLVGSNRSYHREFWDWIPEATHFQNVNRCLSILREAFGDVVHSFVPPGNVYSAATLRACVEAGIRVVNCNNPKISVEGLGLRVLGNERVLAFHDREMVLFGVNWLEKALAAYPSDTNFCFVSEL
jgi:hypothetical protein